MSQNINDSLKEFENLLDSYTSKVGLDKIIYNDDVEKVLLLNENQLTGLAKVTLEEYAFLLAQYGAVLSRENNRNKVRALYAENMLNSIISKYYDKYCGQYMKFDVVKYTIINSDTAASALNKIILHANARILEVEDVIQHISLMSKILSNISRSK